MRIAAFYFFKDEKAVVMVEWVALTGTFVAILMLIFLAIGDKANTVADAVNTDLETIVTSAGGDHGRSDEKMGIGNGDGQGRENGNF